MAETGEKQEENRKPGTFPPGVSGNPNGRPKKGYSITEAFRNMLAAEPEVKAQIVNSIKEGAIKGDRTAQKMVWEYMDGKPVQGVELSNPGGEPLSITVTFQNGN